MQISRQGLWRIPRPHINEVTAELERRPDPPRPFSTWRAIRMQYRDPPLRNAAAWSILMLAVMAVATARTVPDSASAFVWSALGIGYLATLAFALGPAAVGITVARAIRSSVLADARVLSIQDDGYDLVLEVIHPRGAFHYVVGIPRDRRGDAEVGAVFRAGADPARNRLLVMLDLKRHGSFAGGC